MSVYPIVKGVRARFTKVNSCGLPIAGAGNRLVTTGFVSVNLDPVMKEAEELEQTNAEGKVCVTERTPPERKYYNAKVELCNVNTSLIGMLTSWQQVLDYDDNSIGFQDQKEVDGDYGVAIEVWTGGRSDDDCPTPTLDSIFSSPTSGKKYGYLLFGAKEFTLDGVEVGAQVSTLTLNGVTISMPQWGRGPYNVAAIDSSGTAGRLLVPLGEQPHFTMFRTPIEPPEETPEAVSLEIATIFTDPDFYFGGPANAPAADVAPDQIDSGTSYALTITGVPTGGDFTLEVTYPDSSTLETGTIAFGASAANVKTALVALDDGYDANDWTVTGSTLPAGTVTVVPPDGVTFAPEDNGLTGGTTPAVHVA